jgi:hypothetical protein
MSACQPAEMGLARAVDRQTALEKALEEGRKEGAFDAKRVTVRKGEMPKRKNRHGTARTARTALGGEPVVLSETFLFAGGPGIDTAIGSVSSVLSVRLSVCLSICLSIVRSVRLLSDYYLSYVASPCFSLRYVESWRLAYGFCG